MDGPLLGYLFVGQSNMHGISEGGVANLLTNRQDALIPHWVQAGSSPVGPGTLGDLTALTGARASDWSFLRTLHSRGIYRAVGCKHAVNGRGLHNWFAPNQEGYQPIIDACTAAEAAYSQPIQWRAIHWVQGQNDAGFSEAAANAYETNMHTLAAALRRDLATPDLYFVCPEHPPGWSTQTWASAVRAGVADFAAADPYALSYAIEDTATRDAGIHYEVDSFEILGTRGANLYLAERPQG